MNFQTESESDFFHTTDTDSDPAGSATIPSFCPATTSTNKAFVKFKAAWWICIVFLRYLVKRAEITWRAGNITKILFLSYLVKRQKLRGEGDI